jgi:predicted nucleotidyltransferase component of viral defense system
VALLGLWRAKFFEKGAFYGGTALRILYGLDRFSEDLDFSLLRPDKDFNLTRYGNALIKEMEGFGFEVTMEARVKKPLNPIQSAFLKTNTLQQLLTIEANQGITGVTPRGKILKIKLEVDTDPPPGFVTETKYLLHPIPFAVRSYTLPDLFAGKVHAILCRHWKNRVKGRDWYDFMWYVANYPELRLAHLEKRMIQTGDWKEGETLRENILFDKLFETIERVDLVRAGKEATPFLRDPEKTALWSKTFFQDLAGKIRIV